MKINNKITYVSLDSILTVLREDIACLDWVEDIEYDKLFEQMKQCFIERGLTTIMFGG